jgi:hypothetical protein
LEFVFVVTSLEAWLRITMGDARAPEDRLGAKHVPTVFVYLMAVSIDSWIREMMPDVMTKPPEDLRARIYAAAGVAKTASLHMVSSWLRNELMLKTRFT